MGFDAEPGPDFHALRSRFEFAGQGHVFRFVDDLDEARLGRLLAQAESIDLDEVALLAALPRSADPAGIVTPPGDELVALGDAAAAASRRAAARERGLAMLADGQVAVVIAAGGQGTRLGSDRPKGMYPCGPISGKPLLHWLTAKVRYWTERFGHPIPVIVMVSAATAVETRAFLAANEQFGLDPAHVHTPCQGSLPPLDDSGRLLLAAPDCVALAPNGHGGVYAALAADGLLSRLRDRGITTLSYVQIDNPLIQPVDPIFLGLHAEAGSRISSKSVAKRGAGEKVGVFARVDGRPAVVEYSELTPEQSAALDADGRLLYGQGSIAAHVLDAGFVAEMSTTRLPVHRARKQVPYVDDSGADVRPEAPNATKFETFLFDAIPLADQALVMETRREEEFSPIKNAEGSDSPATSRADVLALHRAWHERAGVPLPPGEEPRNVEVDPFDAPDEAAFRARHGVVARSEVPE